VKAGYLETPITGPTAVQIADRGVRFRQAGGAMTRDAAIVTKAYTSALPAGWVAPPCASNLSLRSSRRLDQVRRAEEGTATEVIADITIYAGPGPCRVGRHSAKQIGGMLERAVNRSNAQGRGDAKGR